MNAYRRLDPQFEAPNQIKASAKDRGSMIRVPIGNSKSARVGEDVKARFTELKNAAADRCPRALGTFVKTPEVHHEIYNRFLWNMF